MADLASILPDVSVIDDVPAPLLPSAALLLAALQSRVAARMATVMPAPAPAEDRLLTVAETAEALQKSETWLYHHAKDLPFTRRVGRGLRFSSTGLRKYLDRQKG